VAASRQREAGFAGEGVSRTDIDLGNPSAYWSAMGEDKISLEFLAACVAAPTDRVNDLDLRMQNIETEIRDLKSRFAELEQRFTAFEESYSIQEARHPRADRRAAGPAAKLLVTSIKLVKSRYWRWVSDRRRFPSNFRYARQGRDWRGWRCR
jgi:hypothetical protein